MVAECQRDVIMTLSLCAPAEREPLVHRLSVSTARSLPPGELRVEATFLLQFFGHR